MAHGTPDYGLFAPKATVYALPDLAELAARLGSPVTHDRRGDVIWFDDFEGGIDRWGGGGTGTGERQDWSALHPRSGGFTYQHTTGSTSSRLSFQLIYLPYPVLGALGIEVAFTMGINIAAFSIRMDAYTGTHGLLSWMQYTISTETFQYLKSDGSWGDLSPTRAMTATPYQNHVAKLVTDYSGEQYKRLIFDEHEYDLSSYAQRKVATATEPQLIGEVRFTGVAGGNRNAWVDNVIVTQNEP